MGLRGRGGGVQFDKWEGGVGNGGEGCSGMQVGDRRLFGLVVACHYTYHSFLEMTEPSVWEIISSAISGSGSYWKARVRSS